MDWPKVLAQESRTQAIILVDQLARKHRLSIRAVRAALKRQQQRGLVERVSRNVFINKLAKGFDPRDLISVLRPNAYVSLESALAEHGISTQIPVPVTSVASSHGRNLRSPSVYVTFRKIKKDLFWGS